MHRKSWSRSSFVASLHPPPPPSQPASPPTCHRTVFAVPWYTNMHSADINNVILPVCRQVGDTAYLTPDRLRRIRDLSHVLTWNCNEVPKLDRYLQAPLPMLRYQLRGICGCTWEDVPHAGSLPIIQIARLSLGRVDFGRLHRCIDRYIHCLQRLALERS